MIKYLKIRNDVRNKIISGKYLCGQLLPSENEFCKIYNASKMTVKHAMDDLVQEGLIIKRRGSGTFVKEINSDELERLKIANQFQGSTALFADKKIKSEILTFEVIKTDKKTDYLGIPHDLEMYHLVRLRFIEEVPYVIENTYMPTDIIENLTLKACKGSIYEYIEEHLRLPIGSFHRKIEARKCSQDESKLLKIENEDPIVVSTQFAYLTDGRQFEYSQSIHRSDMFSLETVLIRKT